MKLVECTEQNVPIGYTSMKLYTTMTCSLYKELSHCQGHVSICINMCINVHIYNVQVKYYSNIYIVNVLFCYSVRYKNQLRVCY